MFPAGAQRFDSDLTLNELRFGLNYRFNGDCSKSADMDVTPPALQTDNFAVHGQTTFLEQYAPPFRSPYAGPNSLVPNQGRETWDATAFLGWRLWSGAEFWVDPEIDQGFGLSNTLGVAGFPSGEAYKVGESVPYARVPRAFIRQTIDLGGDSEKVDAAANQFSGSQTANRLVITIGKFAVTDIFDTNKYAHDPRNDFMNWALIDTGTFDYAADAWGFTYGAAAEWYQGDWTVRGGLFDLSIVPNSAEPRHDVRAIPVGRRDRAALRALGSARQDSRSPDFSPAARMGSFADASRLAAVTGAPGRHRGGAPISQPRRRQPQSRAADHRRARRVRARRLCRRQYRALRFHRHRPHRRGGPVAQRQAMGPPRRHLRPRRRGQRHHQGAPAISQ